MNEQITADDFGNYNRTKKVEPKCSIQIQTIFSFICKFFSDCLICRILSALFTLQAGIIWLGCKNEFENIRWIELYLVAFNFILQLLFLPFGQYQVHTFVGSYLMVPGTVAL